MLQSNTSALDDYSSSGANPLASYNPLRLSQTKQLQPRALQQEQQDYERVKQSIGQANSFFYEQRQAFEPVARHNADEN